MAANNENVPMALDGVVVEDIGVNAFTADAFD